MKIKILFLIVFLAMITFNSCRKTASYEVYALKFREAGTQPATGAYKGATSADSIDVCYMIWFLKGNNGRNILVDAGDLDSSEAVTRKYVRPDILLGDIGINTSSISDIIITHPHFDHVGGLKQFGSGKVWMQKKDYEYFTRDAWLDSNFRMGFDTNDVKHLKSVNAAGRLNLVDGDNFVIIPGVRVFTGSGHTKENQYLLVDSDTGKKILLASDAIWFYPNLEKMVPIETFVTDPDQYVNAMKRMKTLVTDTKYIIPGHDNAVFSRFKKINDRVVKIE